MLTKTYCVTAESYDQLGQLKNKHWTLRTVWFWTNPKTVLAAAMTEWQDIYQHRQWTIISMSKM